MKPDDIFARPPNTSFPGLVNPLGSFAWMGTPMFAMQNITRRAPSSEDPFMHDVNTSLSKIISTDRVQSLLDM